VPDEDALTIARKRRDARGTADDAAQAAMRAGIARGDAIIRADAFDRAAVTREQQSRASQPRQCTSGSDVTGAKTLLAGAASRIHIEISDDTVWIDDQASLRFIANDRDDIALGC